MEKIKSALLGSSPMMTLAGVVVGAFPILEDAYRVYETGGEVNWMKILFGIAIMAMGRIGKQVNDHGVGK